MGLRKEDFEGRSGCGIEGGKRPQDGEDEPEVVDHQHDDKDSQHGLYPCFARDLCAGKRSEKDQRVGPEGRVKQDCQASQASAVYAEKCEGFL